MADPRSEDPTTALLIAGEDTAAPSDSFRLAYFLYFLLGAGFLLPWNAFITAVDYFAYLYPSASVDRVFSVSYMLSSPLLLLLLLLFPGDSRRRTNAGIGILIVALIVPPAMDAVVVRGERGKYGVFGVTVGAVVAAGAGDALVQGGFVGAAGEMPERYMQAVYAGTAASGNIVFPPPDVVDGSYSYQ